MVIRLAAERQMQLVPCNNHRMGRKRRRRTDIAVPTVSIPPEAPKPPRLKHVLICAALGVVTLLAYSNSFHGGFVIDSRYIILKDTRLQQATAENVNLIFQHTYWWPTNESGLYRPATTLSYLFNYSVLGNADHPEGYHWINFLLHFLNVLLVYALALRLMRKLWPAAFVAALWAVHPVLTESVTNIIGRADLLAAAAVLSGLLMYLKSTEFIDWRKYAWLAGLMIVTTIGVFSKESAVAILGVIVLYEITWWNERKQHRGLLLGCAATALPTLVMLYVRMTVLAASRPAEFPFVDNPLVAANFFRARLTAIVVMAKYLWLLVWPARLSADYSYAQIPIATGTLHEWIAWIAVAAVALAVASQFKANRLWFFFGAFAFVTFVPVSNLLFMSGTIMAERFLYLPSVGFAACAVMAVYAICERIHLPILAPIALCVFITGFGVRTWVRNLDWQSDLASAASVRTSPNSFKAHLGRARQLAEADPTGSNIDEVIAEAEKGLAILDGLPDALNASNMYAQTAGYYVRKGDLLVRKDADGKPIVPPESIEEYQKALQLLMRGVAIDNAHEPALRERLRASGKYADIPTGVPDVYGQLAITYMRLGQYQNAADTAVRARLLDPSRTETYVLLGQALAREGRKPEASVALLEGALSSGQRSFLRLLDGLYRDGVDTEGCAMIHSPNGLLLNNKCAVVHDETCQAWAELIQLYVVNQSGDLADESRSKAMARYGCPADVLH